MGGMILMLIAALTLPPVADSRNLNFDPTLRSAYAAKWTAWSRIYQRYENWSGAKVSLPAGQIKGAAEYRFTAAPDFRELAAAGYNTVVLLFDERDGDRIGVIHAAHGAGLAVWIAYCPERETHETSVFPDPVRLGSTTRRLGAAADALLIGWRRTSVHLFQQDRAYSAFLIASARADHPELPVIGELYVGEAAGSFYRHNAPAVQLPPEASAAIVVNYAIPSVWPEGASQVLKRMEPPRKILVVEAANSSLIADFETVGFRDYVTIVNKGEKR